MPRTPATNHPQPQPASDAWAFVLSRSSQIDRLAARFFRLLGPEDRADARADYVARIVEQHPRLRLEGALNTEMVIVTWLGWQARAVQQTYCRSYRKHEQRRDRDVVLVGVLVEDDRPSRELASTDGDNTPQGVERTVVECEAQALVERLYGMASPKQREAMLTILMEMAPDEMRGRYHLSASARARRLADLRDAAARAGITNTL